MEECITCSPPSVIKVLTNMVWLYWVAQPKGKQFIFCLLSTLFSRCGFLCTRYHWEAVKTFENPPDGWTLLNIYPNLYSFIDLQSFIQCLVYFLRPWRNCVHSSTKSNICNFTWCNNTFIPYVTQSIPRYPSYSLSPLSLSVSLLHVIFSLIFLRDDEVRICLRHVK